MELTQDRLKEIATYDNSTGEFVWKVTKGGAIKGRKMGSVNARGYFRIQIEGRSYTAHRLAWLYVHGYFPKMTIDHIDGNKLNNKIENLREASFAQNVQNQRKAQRSNKSGYLGVSFAKKTGRWSARIKKDGKKIHLGGFATPLEAHEAYLSAKRRLHEFCTI